MSDENKSSSAPPWRTETWRLTHGPEGDRQTRWFLARLNDGDRLWSLKEPGTPYFIAGTLSPADGVALMAERAVDPVIEKLDPGSPDDLRAEINYLRSREAYFASVLKVADGGQYRADWKAPIQRVLDENKALRDGQEAARLGLLACLLTATGDPRYSVKDNTMAVADLTAALEKSVAALCRMREEALESRAHAERTATVLLGASGAQKPAADGPGLWVVRRPNEKPALVVVGEGAAPPVTLLDGSDPGWGKHADRTDWTWERLPEAHAAMAQVGYGEGYTDGARTMRQDAAARLARQASERLAVSRNAKAGWHSRNLADAEAAVLGDAEREVRGLALPAPGVPRGE